MRYKILVIESELVVANKLVSIFAGVGFTTVAASDYLEVMLKMERFNPDMVIMDSVLPDKDGFEVCSELRNRFHVPVILLGHEHTDKIWEKVMESGAEHYEVKPFHYLSLAARVKSILRRYRPVVSTNR